MLSICSPRKSWFDILRFTMAFQLIKIVVNQITCVEYLPIILPVLSSKIHKIIWLTQHLQIHVDFLKNPSILNTLSFNTEKMPRQKRGLPKQHGIQPSKRKRTPSRKAAPMETESMPAAANSTQCLYMCLQVDCEKLAAEIIKQNGTSDQSNTA